MLAIRLHQGDPAGEADPTAAQASAADGKAPDPVGDKPVERVLSDLFMKSKFGSETNHFNSEIVVNE